MHVGLALALVGARRRHLLERARVDRLAHGRLDREPGRGVQRRVGHEEVLEVGLAQDRVLRVELDEAADEEEGEGRAGSVGEPARRVETRRNWTHAASSYTRPGAFLAAISTHCLATRSASSSSSSSPRGAPPSIPSSSSSSRARSLPLPFPSPLGDSLARPAAPSAALGYPPFHWNSASSTASTLAGPSAVCAANRVRTVARHTSGRMLDTVSSASVSGSSGGEGARGVGGGGGGAAATWSAGGGWSAGAGPARGGGEGARCCCCSLASEAAARAAAPRRYSAASTSTRSRSMSSSSSSSSSLRMSSSRTFRRLPLPATGPAPPCAARGPARPCPPAPRGTLALGASSASASSLSESARLM